MRRIKKATQGLGGFLALPSGFIPLVVDLRDVGWVVDDAVVLAAFYSGGGLSQTEGAPDGPYGNATDVGKSGLKKYDIPRHLIDNSGGHNTTISAVRYDFFRLILVHDRVAGHDAPDEVIFQQVDDEVALLLDTEPGAFFDALVEVFANNKRIADSGNTHTAEPKVALVVVLAPAKESEKIFLRVAGFVDGQKTGKLLVIKFVDVHI